MYAKPLGVFFTAVAFGIGQCYRITDRLFSASNAYRTAGNVAEFEVPAYTTLHCATLCEKSERCATFTYDKTTHICQMSEGVVTGGVMFGPRVGNCPTGYRVYVRKKQIRCMKYIATKMDQLAATDECNKDRAHLVLIEDESMLQFVGDIARENNFGEVWVDGTGGPDFVTHEGDALPYIPPGSEMKEKEPCIRFVPTRNIFKDYSCDIPNFAVLCQINVA